MAEIQEYLGIYEDLNTEVVALSTDSQEQSMNCIEKMNLSYTLLCDTQKKVIDLFHLQNPFEHDGIAYPGSFIIAPDGRIRCRSLDGTASRLNLKGELSFLEQLSYDRSAAMETPPKKSWILPSPQDTWRMTRNMAAKGSFADWKHFMLLPMEYLQILKHKITPE